MRKIFFLILLCILCFLFYWFRGYFWTYFSGNTENSQLSYTLLYQEALKRSKESIKTYSVIVSQADMENSTNRSDTLSNQDRTALFAKSEFNTKQMQMQSDLGDGNGAGQSFKLPNGDFGSLGTRGALGKLDTPSFGSDGSGGGSGDGSCRGIIFTPCIEAKLLETYEGPWKLQKSGSPIYNSIEAIPKNMF